MSRKLAMNTTVNGETYKAGSVPPPEVAKSITNPKSWGESVAEKVDEPAADEPADDAASVADEDPAEPVVEEPVAEKPKATRARRSTSK